MAKPPKNRPKAEARLLTHFGRNVRDARAHARLSQDALAELAGVSQASISSIELGETAPSVVLIYRLARALDIDATSLLHGLGLPADQRR